MTTESTPQPATETAVPYWLCVSSDQGLSTDNSWISTGTESLFYLSATPPERGELADSEPFLLLPSWAAPHSEHWERTLARQNAAQEALQAAQDVFNAAVLAATLELAATQADYAPTEAVVLAMRDAAEAAAS